MYKLIAQQHKARAGEFHTHHGIIQTPCFMNVGTCAAIKGAVSTRDLEEIGCQVQLSNTYHLHVRMAGDLTGDQLIRNMGGLQKFMNWNRPILTDSGGFQVFSLSKLRKITENGVEFTSHIDGRKIFMTPELSMQIQHNLGSTIVMAFDECIETPATHEYVQNSSDMTIRWLKRCKTEVERLNTLHQTQQVLFGINQGGIYPDIRIANMKAIAEENLPGYAIGGLAVGESAEQMYETIETVEPHMPQDKPRYLMGVGTPQNIIEAVKRGIDFFDCVMPARNARHGKLFTFTGDINILNSQYIADDSPIDSNCTCPTCRDYSRSYLRHLFKSGEMLGLRLAVLHNLHFYNHLMQAIRKSIIAGTFDNFTLDKIPLM